jgi:hypothetical protein
MKYPFIFYSATGPVGSSIGPFIQLRTDLKDDAGLLAHELTHVKQWLALSLLGIPVYFGLIAAGLPQWAPAAIFSLALKDLLYTASSAFREWAEVQAYRAQISFGLDPYAAALSLSKDYGLIISATDAYRKLTK